VRETSIFTTPHHEQGLLQFRLLVFRIEVERDHSVLSGWDQAPKYRLIKGPTVSNLPGTRADSESYNHCEWSMLEFDLDE
jgi:hypothetical protein